MSPAPKSFYFAAAIPLLLLLAAPATAADKVIDLNSATAAELATLPGVDATLAQTIIQHRPYQSIDELRGAGIPPEQVKKIAEKATAKPLPRSQTAPAKKADNAPKPPPVMMVWVDLESKLYYRPGETLYQKTKEGKLLTEEAAKKQGYKSAPSK